MLNTYLQSHLMNNLIFYNVIPLWAYLKEHQVVFNVKNAGVEYVFNVKNLGTKKMTLCIILCIMYVHTLWAIYYVVGHP